MFIKKVNSDYDIKPFDCGDADLNGFLLNDAKSYAEKKIAYTFVLEDDEGKIIAYYSLLNDKIAKVESSNAAWRKVKKIFPHDKHFGSYPAIKIGRFAVDNRFRGEGMGSKLMKILKDALAHKDTDSAFRFLSSSVHSNTCEGSCFLSTLLSHLQRKTASDFHHNPKQHGLHGR